MDAMYLNNRPPVAINRAIRACNLARPSHYRRSSQLALLGVILVASVGCEPSPFAQQRITYREDHVRRTAEAFAQSEASRPERLRQAVEFISYDLNRTSQHFQRDLDYVDFWWQRDVKRMRDRQPEYEQELGRILRGKPETIERNAIIMFF